MIKLALVLALSLTASRLDNQDPPDLVNPREVFCLYEALWHEARGESLKGVMAVATVIRNRVYSGQFPSSYCKVIYQYKQFSYVHLMPKRYTPVVMDDWQKQLYRVSVDTVKGTMPSVVSPTVMWYHTTKVNPKWAGKFSKVIKIDSHIFYRKVKYERT